MIFLWHIMREDKYIFKFFACFDQMLIWVVQNVCNWLIDMYSFVQIKKKTFMLFVRCMYTIYHKYMVMCQLNCNSLCDLLEYLKDLRFEK